MLSIAIHILRRTWKQSHGMYYLGLISSLNTTMQYFEDKKIKFLEKAIYIQVNIISNNSQNIWYCHLLWWKIVARSWSFRIIVWRVDKHCQRRAALTTEIVVLTKSIFLATNTRTMMYVIRSFHGAPIEINPNSCLFSGSSRLKRQNTELEEEKINK